MFRNLLKISFRNLIKNKAHTFINVIGLSLGISAAIVIYRVIDFDMSFDNYHSDSDRIYRVVTEALNEGEVVKLSGSTYELERRFKQDFNETEYLSIVDTNVGSPVITTEENGNKTKYSESENNLAYVNSEYFKIFDHKFLVGDKENPFPEIKTLVLSKSYAEKYFGDYLEAYGKIIRFDNLYDLKVTGVIEDAPKNTDLPSDFLISFNLGQEDYRGWDDWVATSSGVQIFVKAKVNVSVDNFNKNIYNYINDNKPADDPDSYFLKLQPLTDMHFDTDRYVLSGRTTSWQSIYTLMVIAVMLVVAACINFINLNTALVSKRAKEIGIRKVLGSARGLLATQFIAETALVTVFSVLVSLGIVELALLNIDTLIGYTLPPTSIDIKMVAFIMLLIVVVTLSSSLYPAMILSGYSPIKALKSKIHSSENSGVSLRKGLIVLQLFIAQALIIIVIAVSNQIDYFLTVPMGIDTEAVVEFSMPGEVDGFELETLRNQMMTVSNVKDVSFSNTGSISNNTWGGNLEYIWNEGEARISHRVKLIDEHYIPALGLEVIAGTNLSNDSAQFMINERALKEMGIENPQDVLGLECTFWGRNHGKIVGVVKNFNMQSLHSGISPVVFAYIPAMFFQGSVRLAKVDQEAIEEIKKIWEAEFPELLFSYTYLDDRIQRFYANEERMSKVFTTFGVIALFIGAIGLIGLISFMANAKTKEIGIRKVLGASVKQIVVMLSRDFVVLVVIAFVLAVPTAYYFLNEWLANFEYQIPLSADIFIGALMATMLVTVCAVGFKSASAALSNPVDALSDE
ncbi:ABC transporter permease [Fulvivirga lutimaris]|uniref:ABC transporter permease n=1 Tax=Fulvivirga lutimaris TaxID=1819566 RepID=UPI0012BCE1CF|nr:FtsX-like permease family protein [Fulvivirga lutimaris]MTI39010.1 FtsX-like permease family protein [Fulvivirga lutimaris]